MKIGFFITARLKSSRLKLKLLKPLNGRNSIERVIDRAKQVIECDEIVLCTSTSSQDLPLVRIAQKNEISYFNGDGEDVLSRLLTAAKLFDLDYIIGITADNPLFSVYHANLLSDLIRQEPSVDFAFTTGMPIGVNIYAIKRKALEVVCKIKEEVDTEIWGYLVNRPELFNVREIPVTKDYVCSNASRITLDYMEDFYFFKEVFARFPSGEVVDVLDVFKLLSQDPAILEINAACKQADLADDVKQRIERFYTDNIEKLREIKQEIYSK